MACMDRSKAWPVVIVKEPQSSSISKPAITNGTQDSADVTAASYQFVLSTGRPGAVSGEPRKALRSHVMRDHFQQKRAARENASSIISKRTITSRQTLKGRFRLKQERTARPSAAEKELQRDTTQLKFAEPYSTPEAGTVWSQYQPQNGDEEAIVQPHSDNVVARTVIFRDLDAHMDPFNASSIQGTPRLETLLYYWTTKLYLNSRAIHVRPNWWFHFASQDPAVLHSVMCNVAAHCALFNDVRLTEDINYHKSEAIKLINMKLRKPIRSMPESVVGAIVTLATFENLWGVFDTSSTYLHGLWRLINTQGGFDALRHNDSLQRGVAWAEYHLSAAWRSLPRIRFNPEPSAAHLPNDLLIEAASTAPHSLLNLSFCGAEIYNTHYSLHQLGISCSSKWKDTVDRTLVSNLLHDIEYRLLCTSNRLSQSLSRDERVLRGAATVAEALTAAAHAFIYGAIRNVPLTVQIFDLFLERICTGLSESNAISVWQEECNLEGLVWALSIAAIVAQTRPQYSSYVDGIAWLLRRLDIQSEEQYVSAMQEYAWTDDFCALPCNTIWKITWAYRQAAPSKVGSLTWRNTLTLGKAPVAKVSESILSDSTASSPFGYSPRSITSAATASIDPRLLATSTWVQSQP